MATLEIDTSSLSEKAPFLISLVLSDKNGLTAKSKAVIESEESGASLDALLEKLGSVETDMAPLLTELFIVAFKEYLNKRKDAHVR